ncbi:hypothetical protein CEH05_05140 [Halobacillus halophilus]|nr:hypothetical protein CEH05_05140 [Halobacillus halophilus]
MSDYPIGVSKFPGPPGDDIEKVNTKRCMDENKEWLLFYRAYEERKSPQVFAYYSNLKIMRKLTSYNGFNPRGQAIKRVLRVLPAS